jgi:hypothetical protein
MQCNNCQFQNMPGIKTCGRCGASLTLATSSINVHPPRATPFMKRLRRWFPAVMYWRRFRTAIAEGLTRPWRSVTLPDMPASPLFLRMVVPGWPQQYVGRTTRARWMFFGYVGLLLLGLLLVGTRPGVVLLGLAISIHAASITEIVCTGVSDFGRRLGYSLLILAVVFVFVYTPIGWLIGQVAAPQQFLIASPPFAAGDVILINHTAYRWSDPRAGDIVSYAFPHVDVSVVVERQAIYRLQGDRVNRILAEPGQKVVCKNGTLLIDGQPSSWQPLVPCQVPDGLNVTVPVGHYFIVASGDILPPSLPLWQAACIVPRSLIHGHVYLQCQPLSKFGRLR